MTEDDLVRITIERGKATLERKPAGVAVEIVSYDIDDDETDYALDENFERCVIARYEATEVR